MSLSGSSSTDARIRVIPAFVPGAAPVEPENENATMESSSSAASVEFLEYKNKSNILTEIEKEMEQKSENDADNNRNRICVNIMNRRWKIRDNRWNQSYVHEKNKSGLIFVLKFLFPNLSFALGNYAGGGVAGDPVPIEEMYKSYGLPAAYTNRNKNEDKVNRLDSVFKPSVETKTEEDIKAVKKILKKMVGNCKMPVIRFLGWFLGKLWRYMFSKIEVSGIKQAQQAFADAARDGKATVFLPTHRSHIDYLLLSYVCYGFNMPIPFIAAGENLNIPVIGPLLSSAGAFFIRRSMKGDPRYKKILKDYLGFILKRGHPVEIFIEGGRTRTGMISDPKLGILNMIVSLVRLNLIQDVVFFPVALDYEKVAESEGYAGNLLGMKKQPESLIGLIKAAVRIFMKRNHPGSACVNFGKTVSVREVINEVNESLLMFGDDEVESSDAVYTLALSGHVVQAQREASTVTVAGILATVLLGFSEDDLLLSSPHSQLEPRFKWLLRILKASGAHCAADLHGVDKPVEWSSIIASALRILNPVFKRIDIDCHKSDSAAKRRLRLRYACGQIIPILAPYAIVSSAFESLLVKKQVGGEKQLCVHVDEVIGQACTLANVVLPHMDGAKVDRRSICSAFFNLCSLGSFKVKEKRVVILSDTNDAITIAMLRTLRILIAPSIHASYAVGAALVSMVDETEIKEKDVTLRAKELLYTHFDTKSESNSMSSTSSTSTFTNSSVETDETSTLSNSKVEIEDIENMMDKLENAKLLKECLPETLSKAELTVAVKHLIKGNILHHNTDEELSLNRQLLKRNTLSHSFSCASFDTVAPQKEKEKESSSSSPSKGKSTTPVSGLRIQNISKLVSHLKMVKSFMFHEHVAPAAELGETFVYRRSRKTYLKFAVAVALVLVAVRFYLKR